jgi:hypothetical protein
LKLNTIKPATLDHVPTDFGESVEEPREIEDDGDPRSAKHFSSLWKPRKKIFSLFQSTQAWVQDLKEMVTQKEMVAFMLERDPSRWPKLLLLHREVKSLDENTRHCEDAALDQKSEDVKISATNGNEAAEGAKRVRFIKRHLVT